MGRDGGDDSGDDGVMMMMVMMIVMKRGKGRALSNVCVEGVKVYFTGRAIGAAKAVQVPRARSMMEVVFMLECGGREWLIVTVVWRSALCSLVPSFLRGKRGSFYTASEW